MAAPAPAPHSGQQSSAPRQPLPIESLTAYLQAHLPGFRAPANVAQFKVTPPPLPSHRCLTPFRQADQLWSNRAASPTLPTSSPTLRASFPSSGPSRISLLISLRSPPGLLQRSEDGTPQEASGRTPLPDGARHRARARRPRLSTILQLVPCSGRPCSRTQGVWTGLHG